MWEIATFDSTIDHLPISQQVNLSISMFSVNKCSFVIFFITLFSCVSCSPKASQIPVNRAELSKQDGDSRDHLLFLKDRRANDSNQEIYRILPDIPEQSELFKMRRLTGTTGGEIQIDKCWVKVTPRVWNQIIDWLPNAQINIIEINGWLMLNKSLNETREEVIAIAIDGGPVFFDEQ